MVRLTPPHSLWLHGTRAFPVASPPKMQKRSLRARRAKAHLFVFLTVVWSLFVSPSHALAQDREFDEFMLAAIVFSPEFAPLKWPVNEGVISSRYGWRRYRGRYHHGIDIALPSGRPVRAAAPGWVTFSGWKRGYGFIVIVEHARGYETRYAHHRRNLVRVGERVAPGTILAEVGSTGNSTGPHLHFEVRKGGSSLDPYRLLE